MKIEKNHIRITGKLSSLDFLRNSHNGRRLTATIAEKINQKTAILEIGGNKVNAEFVHGLPASGKLSLIFEKEANGTFYFRIAGQYSEADLLNGLNRIIIYDFDLFKSIHKLRAYLKEGNIDIIGLNIVLLNQQEHERTGKAEKIKNLFNKLLLKGAEYKNLDQITALIYSWKSESAQMMFYLLSLLFSNNFKYFSKINNKITEQTTYFTDLINESFIDDDKTDAVHDILDFIAVAPDKESGLIFDEVIFFDGDKFKTCKYIINNNRVLLSLNLSNLGNISILINHDKSYYIAFYAEGEESLRALKGEIEKLESSLKLFDKNNIYITFYNSKNEIEKIIEIIYSMDLKYNLDIKA